MQQEKKCQVKEKKEKKIEGIFFYYGNLWKRKKIQKMRPTRKKKVFGCIHSKGGKSIKDLVFYND